MNQLLILICLCVVSCSDAVPSKFSDTLQNVEKKVEDELNVPKNKIVGMWNNVERKVQDACYCINYSCGCCAHLEEKEIELNSTICANVTYLVHDYGISFTVTVNDYTLFNETVSARNPPPVCIGVPYVKELIDACIRLYDINATTTYLHACVRFEARMKVVLIAKYEFGCFNIGPPGSSKGPSTSTVLKDSQIKAKELAASKERNVANMTAAAVALTVGLIVLVALTVFGVIVWAQRRGNNNACFRDLLRRQTGYGSLLAQSHDGYVKC